MKRGWAGLNWVLLVTGLLLTTIFFFGDWCMSAFQRLIPSLQIGDIDLNEEIDNYWASLDDEDRKWSQGEEKNNREQLRIKILTDEQQERLSVVGKTSGKTLQGCHTYDVLANPLYLDDFQYVSAAEPDRVDLIIDDDTNDENDAMQSDLVRLALNLAYMSER